MDALLSYESSSSDSDGERVTEDEPLSKKPAIGRTPDLVTVRDYSCSSSDDDEALIRDGFAELLERPNSDSEVSDSNVQTDSHRTPTFGFEGFHPTDSDQVRKSKQERKGDTQVDASVGESASPSTSFAVGGKRKRNPYALNIGDLNPGMRTFLNSVKKYFTQKVNLERQKAALCATTYDKAQERILGFLGYTQSVMDSRELSPEVFMRVTFIEAYVEFLKESRHCSSATVSNHISSILYPIKFLHREDGPLFNNVPIIKQLRVQATLLQKEGDLERPSSKEDFAAQNRWLPWDQVVQAVTTQRERFELAGPVKARARECCDLVMVSLYVFIPPSRGLEIRTLEVMADGQDYNLVQYKDRNVLLIKDDALVLHFHNYKTRRFSGRDELALQNDHELCHILRIFVKDYRAHLTTERSGDFLLLNKNGDAFTAAAFSAHLKAVFHGLTGKLISVNMLRSSFITWAYSQDDCTDALKSSLAAALRHSTRQAQHTYDRRTANERKGLAVDMARRFAERSQEDGGVATQPSEPSEACQFKPGDFVACVEKESTVNAPKILLGQVRCVRDNGEEASLLWYKAVSANMYKLELDGLEWCERLRSLVPVSVQAAKNRPGVYRLQTSRRQIHKAVLTD